MHKSERVGVTGSVSTSAPNVSEYVPGGQKQKRLALAHRWSLKSAMAVLDQGFISGSNFVVAVLLARHITPRQYGAYALAFESFLLLAVTYGAFVLEPMSVFGPSLYRDDLRGYLGTLLRLHICISFGIVSLALISAAILLFMHPGSETAAAIAGVGIAAPFILLFWLARRAFYVKSSPAKAFLGASAYCSVLMVGLLLFARFGWLAPFSAFILMGCGATLAGGLLLLQLKPRIESGSAASDFSQVLAKHWKYGRWSLASATAIWLSAAIFYPLLGKFRGLEDTAQLKAAMNISSPVGQVFAATSLLFLPYISRVNHLQGSTGTRQMMWRLLGLYAGGTSLYWAAILLVHQPLIHFLYHDKYGQISALLPWVAISAICRMSATAQAIALRAMQSPWAVCVAYVAAGIVAIILGVPLCYAYGLKGAVVAMAISSATATAGTLWMIRRVPAQASALESATDPRLAVSGV